VKVIAQTTNTNRTTTSNVFAQIPEAAANVTQVGSANGCVIVDFSAMVNTLGTTALYVTATLDGKASLPDYSQLIANNGTFEARSTSFVFSSVTPGLHQVKVLFRSSTNGTAVNINRSNIIIHYGP
jgi:hypothetical protein